MRIENAARGKTSKNVVHIRGFAMVQRSSTTQQAISLPIKMLEAQVTHFLKPKMWCKMHVSLLPIHFWIIGFVGKMENLILT